MTEGDILEKLTTIYSGYQVQNLFRDSAVAKVTLTELTVAVANTQNRNVSFIPELSQLFLPIAVNPSSSVRSNFIKSTFTFSNSGVSSKRNEPFTVNSINYSKETLNKFVWGLIDKAKALADLRDDALGTRRQVTPKFEIVEGKKGVGKTHLQNFILTEYTSHFNKEKVVWFRINLIRSFGPEESISIFQWAKCQLAKILVRYYDPNSEFYSSEPSRLEIEVEWKKELFEYIKRIHGDTDYKLFAYKYTEMTTFLQRLQVKSLDDIISPIWMPQDLADAIFDLAQSKFRMKFILIIDGLDLLTETKIQRERFYNRKRAVENFLESDAHHSIYSVIFLRPKTFEGMQQLKGRIQTDPTNQVQYDQSHSFVSACDVNQIFDNRIAYLFKPDSVIDVSSDTVGDFIDFVTKGESDVSKKSGGNYTWLELIKEISKDNVRSATQVLGSVPFIFENSEYRSAHSSHPYKFIQMSMLGDRLYPSKSYSYSREDGEWARSLGENPHVHDTLFLPSIFSFPYDTNELAIDVLGKEYFVKYIHNLRILQVFDLYFTQNHERADNNDTSVVLEIVFGYDRASTKAIMEELSEAEVIDIECNLKNQDHFDIFSYSSRLSRKGEKIVNSFIDDISYLGLCLLTSPLPTKIVTRSRNGHDCLLLASPKNGSILEWIVAKVVNGLTLAKIIETANQIQTERIRARRSRIKTAIREQNFASQWSWVISQLGEENSSLYLRPRIMQIRALKSAARAIAAYGIEEDVKNILEKIARSW
jgi:hypothetical protein